MSVSEAFPGVVDESVASMESAPAINGFQPGAQMCYIAATAFDDFFDLDTVCTLDPEMAAEVAAMPVAKQLGALATLCEGAVSPAFLLGHSTYTLTLDVYGDYIPEQDGGALNTLPEPPAGQSMVTCRAT